MIKTQPYISSGCVFYYALSFLATELIIRIIKITPTVRVGRLGSARVICLFGVENTDGDFFPLLSFALCHVGENILLSDRIFVRWRIADFARNDAVLQHPRRESRRRTRLGSNPTPIFEISKAEWFWCKTARLYFFEFTMPFCIFWLARGTFRRICRPAPSARRASLSPRSFRHRTYKSYPPCAWWKGGAR